MTCLRLSIEPIPEGSRLASLANLLPGQQWDRIRRSVYQRAGYRCQICGREGILHCHEVWQYNEETRCQWLAGFQALCQDCHDVKHILFNRKDARPAELLRHFITVNRLTSQEADEHMRAACQRQWTINYGAYNWQMPPLAGLSQRQAFVKCMGSR